MRRGCVCGGVASIWSAGFIFETVLGVAYQFDVLELIVTAGPDVFRLADMRHVTPVVSAVLSLRRGRRVVDEAIDALTGENSIKVIDGALRGSVPFCVDSESGVGGEDR